MGGEHSEGLNEEIYTLLDSGDRRNHQEVS
uniref:Uncharacterized protein n=1 Tax=Anguilla anguilla TaxID=7936 RepID=A0A0E9PWH2_ANGAN